MRRAVGAFVLLSVVAAGALGGGASPGGGGIRSAAAAGPLHGVSGNRARFQTQTGQDSTVVQVFIGWGQGVSWGSRLDVLIPTLQPIPMLHLGTKGKDGREAITPAGIAAGAGDGDLIAIGQAIARYGRAIYIRPMAEMNNTGTPYSAYGPDGRPRGPAHSAASYRKAFARIYLILHGGPSAVVDAKLRALGLPPVHGDLAVNPFPQLRIVWSPLAGGTPKVPGNLPEDYYPGPQYVDVDGADIYDDGLVDNAPWAELEALYRLAQTHRKPFSVPEWGLFSVDDPAFVAHMCSFLETHGATEMQAFFVANPSSPLDLQTKPKSRGEYRRCITPMPEAVPSWAGGSPAVSAVVLKLTAVPAAGPPPLAVQFAIAAQLTVPIVRWQLYFGDGTQVGGPGQPPGTVQHQYGTDGSYDAILVVYTAPPFTPDAARFLVAAPVAVGSAPPVVGFQPAPAGGRAPVKVVFRTDVQLTGTVAAWEIVFGDGNSARGSGPPPRFVGHTYTAAGSYRAVLVLDESPTGRIVAYADVSVSGATAGGTPPPPATATAVGTVLVGGAPFRGGSIPYGSRVDVTRGRLTLTTDSGTLTVYGGGGVPAVFVLVHSTLGGKPIVELRLAGGDFSVCTKRKVSVAAAKAPPATTVRRLWASGKGRFRTKGRYVAAAVLGTIWLTADRCDASLVTVRRGTVQVTDVPRRRTVKVRAGHTYVAKKP